MRHFLTVAAASCVLMLCAARPTVAAETYAIDNAHTGVNFKVKHAGIAWVFGRFNQVDGQLVLDNDATKSSLSVTIPVESIDTKITQRDDHLRSPDFFDAKTHPEIVFKSNEVKATNDGLEVSGTFTLHGVSKPLTLKLTGGEKTEFPEGVHRIGYSTNVVLKRSDFDMKTMIGPIGDEIHVSISFEAVRQ